MAEGGRWARWLGAAGGLGFLPLFPGTWASAAAAAVAWAARERLPWGWWAVAILFVAVLLAGLASCGAAERALGRKDPRPFVLDELAGQWLTCLVYWAPGQAWKAVAAALVAFRFFDAVKPLWVRCAERLPGAWGVMADDLAAALSAGAVLWVGRWAWMLLEGVGPWVS